MRHPIYTGWLLGALGWALLTGSRLGVGVALAGGIFYDLKAREEEKWLAATYADYTAYQRQVKRFIPWTY
jgi:protein-S-isoprenylcysteine O-methyltransferase Ste14